MYYHYGKFIGGCPLLGGYKCTITMGSLLEVVLFLEVTNVLSLWGGCPLLGGYKCTITMGSEDDLSFVQRLSSFQSVHYQRFQMPHPP